MSAELGTTLIRRVCAATWRRTASAAWVWLGPISGSHQGLQPERLHSEAGYMAAPERFAEPSDSFPLHRGRRPYMTHLCHPTINFAVPHNSALANGMLGCRCEHEG